MNVEKMEIQGKTIHRFTEDGIHAWNTEQIARAIGYDSSAGFTWVMKQGGAVDIVDYYVGGRDLAEEITREIHGTYNSTARVHMVFESGIEAAMVKYRTRPRWARRGSFLREVLGLPVEEVWADGAAKKVEVKAEVVDPVKPVALVKVEEIRKEEGRSALAIERVTHGAVPVSSWEEKE